MMSDRPLKVPTTGMPIAQRPTLAELAAMAAKKSGGCPRCGCNDWRPAGRYFAGDQLLEKRTCRNCGHARPAVPVSSAPQSAAAIKLEPIDPLDDFSGLP